MKKLLNVLLSVSLVMGVALVSVGCSTGTQSTSQSAAVSDTSSAEKSSESKAASSAETTKASKSDDTASASGETVPADLGAKGYVKSSDALKEAVKFKPDLSWIEGRSVEDLFGASAMNDVSSFKANFSNEDGKEYDAVRYPLYLEAAVESLMDLTVFSDEETPVVNPAPVDIELTIGGKKVVIKSDASKSDDGVAITVDGKPMKVSGNKLVAADKETAFTIAGLQSWYQTWSAKFASIQKK